MFVPLRVHSVYSKGRGGAVLTELASWGSQQKLPALALSDLENLYGWGRWKRIAQKNKLRPLFGCEIKIQEQKFLFLVKDREGYWSLMEIFNGKKLGDTRGLVTIFIPRAGEPESPQGLGAAVGEDFYLGANFYNWERVDTWCRQYNLPAVWANPLKFI
ncbi:MAG: PHP domain-containing protein, partial [Candidatus Aminicenantes bacterium]|nr:PHP domain-containing protein [Candidatus Aminicenantes bacterium]